MIQENQAFVELNKFLTDELGQEFDSDEAQEEIQSIATKLEESKDVMEQFKKILKDYGKKGNELNTLLKDFANTKFYKMKSQVVIQQVVPTLDNYQDQRILLNELNQDRQKMLKVSYQEQTKTVCLEYDLYDLIMKSMVLKNQLLREEWTKLTKLSQQQISISSIKNSAKKLKTKIEAQKRINQKITQSLTDIQNERGNIVDHLIVIKKQLNVIDVMDLERLINKSKSAQQSIKNKSIILFIGDTGAGKTTTILSLLGHKMKKKKFKGMTWVTTAETLTDEKLKLLHSSPQLKSITRYPLAILPKQKLDPREQIWFVDTPGFGDSAGCEVDLANGIGTITAITNCKHVRPVIIISSQSWGTRGNGIRKLAKLLANIFSSYQQVNDSVTFIFNRFTTEALNDLNNALQNLIDNPTPEDKTNQNLLSLYEDLVKKTSKLEDIINFDPLKEGQYNNVVKKIIKSQKLKNPAQYFSIAFTQSTQSNIKLQCSIFDRIIKYKFNNNDLQQATYYLRNLNKMKELIPTQVPRIEYSKIIKQLEKQINQKFKKFSDEFNSQIKLQTLEEEDIIQAKNKILGLRKYHKLFNEFMQVPDQKIFNEQVQQQADKLIQKIQQSTQISKTLKIAKILLKHFQLNKLNQIQNILKQRLQRLENAYENWLKQKEYHTCAEIYTEYEDLLKIEYEYKDKKYEKDSNILLKKLPNLINMQLEKLKESPNKIDTQKCHQWIDLENNFTKIKNCYPLMAIHENIAQLQDKIKEFKNILVQKGIKNIQSLKKIIIDLKQNRLDEIANIEERFSQLNLLKEISCVKLQIESKMQECMESIQNYLIYQEKTLQQICDAIENHDSKKKLKSLLINLEKALTTIQKLTNLGNGSIKIKGVSLAEKVIQSVLRFFTEASESLDTLTTDFKKQIRTLANEWEKLSKINDQMLIFKGMKRKFSQNTITTIMNKIDSIIQKINSQLNIQLQEIEMKSKQPQNMYTRLNFKIIDKCIYFLQHYANRIKSQTKMPEIDKKREIFRIQLNRYKNYVENQITSNIKFFETLKTTKQNDQNRIRQKLTKVRIEQISQIETKYQFIREFSFEGVEQFKMLISDSLDDIYENFKKISKQMLAKSQNEELQIMIVKCSHFNAIDKVLNRTQNFKNLASQIDKQMISTCNKLSNNLKTFINVLNIQGIRREFQRFKNESQSQEMKEMHRQSKIDLENKVCQVIDEIKKKKKVTHDQQNSMMEDFDHLEKITELISLAQFLQKPTKDNLDQFKDEISKDIQANFNTQIRQIETLLQQYYFETVLKKFRKLAKIEIQITNKKIKIQYNEKLLDKQDLDGKSIIQAYQNYINKKIIEIKKTYVENQQLRFQKRDFLKIYENICSENSNFKQLKSLKQQMYNNVTPCYQNLFREYENSSGLESDTLEQQIRNSFQNLPNQLKFNMKQKFPSYIQRKHKMDGQIFQKIVKIFKNTENVQTLITQINDILKKQNEQQIQKLHSQISKYIKKIYEEIKTNPKVSGILTAYKIRISNFFGKISPQNSFKSYNQYTQKIAKLIQEKMNEYNTQITKLLKKKSGPTISTQLKQIYQKITQGYNYLKQNLQNNSAIKTTFYKKFEDSTNIIFSELKKQVPIIQSISSQQPAKIKKDVVDAFNILDNIEASFTYMKQFYSQIEEKNDITKQIMASNQFNHSQNKNKFKTDFLNKINQFKNLNFSIDGVLNEDGALDQIFKTVNQNFKFIESYQEIYSKYNEQQKKNYYEECEQIIKQKIDILNKQGLQIINNYFLKAQENLQKLNYILMFLTACQKKYYKQNKKFLNQYEQSLNINMNQAKNQSQNSITQISKTVQYLKHKELAIGIQMKKKKEQKIKDESQRSQSIRIDVQEQFKSKIEEAKSQQQKKKYENEKQIQLSKIQKQLNQSRMSISNEIETEYTVIKSQKMNSIESNRIKIAKILIKIKLFSTKVSYFYANCKQEIDNIIKTYQNRLGDKAINQLAFTLNAQKSESANRLLHEIKCFQNYRVIQYNRKVKNAGIEYVLKNLDVYQFKKEKLKRKYQLYLEVYNKNIQIYAEKKNKETIEDLINNIKSCSTKVKLELKNQKSHDGHELIALIFALWTILKAKISEEGSVCYLYSPHPAQIIAIFCVLGIGDKGQLMGNRLAQVKTGEGKSVVLAGLSAYFGCLGYQVSCACYSKYLSQRDGNQFSVLFDKLRIRQHIKYGTFNEICQKILNPRGFQLRQEVLKTLKQPVVDVNKFKDMSKQLTDLKNYSTDSTNIPQNKILLIDQIDVFFSQDFYGKSYVPYVSVRHETIQDLLSLVWDNRTKEISQIRDIVYNSNQLKNCIQKFSSLEKIIREAVKGMIGTVRNWQHDYIICDDKIAYRQQDGISLTANYGYKTTFAYYYEYGRKNISRISRNNAAQIGLTVGQFSYAELPKYFTHILGVTGTLKTLSATKQEIVRNEYKITDNYFIPSVYDKPKLTHNGIKICKQEDYFEQIIKQTQRVINQNRPVIIFFDNYLKASQFQSSQKFESLAKSSMILSQQNEQNERKFRIQRSTTAGRITISTRSFSRGTDFNVFDTDLIERGGLHIIQTFLSEEESEQIQIIGRTARQGSKGSYKLIIKEDQLEKYALKIQFNGQNCSIQGKTSSQDQLRIINEKRNKYYDENYKRFLQQTTQLKDDHLKSMQMISNILNNQNSNVCEYVQKLNTFPELIIKKLRIIRTILGLDATGSMGQALLKTTKILGNSFNRVYDIIKQKSQDASFQIQIAVYRNYNSPIQQIFLFSPFESQPQNLTNFLKNIKASGGWGNQAVQVLYDYINQTKNINQVIIIGDAPSNNFLQTKTKRKDRGQNYWKATKLQNPLNSDEQLKKIIDKQIPIHSFYILNPMLKNQKKTKEYFGKVSKESGGVSQQFKPNEKQAQNKLTDFIVTNILNKIGGQQLVEVYKEKYVVRH